MKKLIFGICLFLSFIISVKASSIDDINFNIKVDDLGTATITETWKANVSQGTEGYHPFYNLGESTITVKSASMDGRDYEVVSYWDEESSLADKAYKAGLYKPNSEETDVVFGISSYGSHTYVVTYEVTNFVVSLNDSDMIYWNIFPRNFSAAPRNVSITISANKEFADTVDVWGFGKKGAPCYVKDGLIQMTSDGDTVDSDEYMTILVKLDKGIFEPTSRIDANFDKYLKMAQEGSDPYNYEGNKTKSSIGDTIAGILGFLFTFIPFIFVGLLAVLFGSKPDKYDFESSGGKSLKDVLPFRDIPCEKDLFMAYFVAYHYNIGKSSNLKSNLLGALILKWILNGNVTVEKVTKDRILLADKIEDNIIFVKEPVGANSFELKMYDNMRKASKDDKLEANEFKKWAKNHYTSLFNWFDDVLDDVQSKMIDKKYITYTEREAGVLKKKYKEYTIQKSLREEAEHLAGLKKFLEEFSQIDKREPIEVKLWNEYLIFAQLLGMAKEVMKQFKKLYPEITEQIESMGYDYTTFVFIDSISSSTVSAASAAKSAAESYSSGGGGFSSGGGGGGSFGGGGGGGGFR
ncbi:MAG: DUF2207 domain-containing protein [Bacilli bacterium]|nr:DUF2207 domain-containing protein [Bacilli bacterium]